MKSLLNKFKKNEKGFTLIELLAVIVILAVIAAIAVPLISNIINKSKNDADIATFRQVMDAGRLYVTAELAGDAKNVTIPVISGTLNSQTKGLQLQGYLDNNLVLPSTKSTITGGSVNYDSNGTLISVSLTTANGTVTQPASVLVGSTATPTPTPTST
ncbi:type II secretion system protein [Paenibacillus aestuarii]|uniref:Type II secretion system protein n=1 Tax=Paenibacillus aestuarii TaxID=516965 RepID=A0ABW0KI11_9BACL|nr:type II secretion system protein [Paenibacillus aestuarii]